MASIIRIKRSPTAGNPGTLGSGELAYSALTGTQSNGGDRLYIGFGTETSGDAANHYVIGGKYFTDMLDHPLGTLTASSALVVDSNSKLDNLKVDNLDLNGNTLSTTNTNGDLILTPNGTGKTVVTNLHIGNDTTSIAEYIYDTVGGAITGGTGITITNNDAANTSTVTISDTTVTAGSYGSASSVPTFTVNARGQLTAAGSATISTSLTVAADSGTADVVLLGTDTLTFTGGTGLDSVVSNNNITFNIDSTIATKTYVDSVLTGLDVKQSVKAASTASSPATYNNGTSGVGATLTNSGTQAAIVLDGVTLLVNDRVLIKDQADSTQNGVYTVTTVGTASTNWVLTRATDFDNSPGVEVKPGTFFFVEQGTTQADNGYVIATNTAITIGTTAITFSQFSGAGQITAGDGLTKSGNTINAVGTTNRISVAADAIDIASTYVGQSSITTLGTIATGIWNGSIIGSTYGGTGVNNGANTITIAGNVTHAGAFTQSFTATANTTLTLPITGTLATLAGSEALSNKTITLSSFSGTTVAASSNVTFTSTTDATALGTAPVVLSGGLSVAKTIYVGTNITGAGPATSTFDGFQIDCGVY